jgi:hypothetical protein
MLIGYYRELSVIVKAQKFKKISHKDAKKSDRTGKSAYFFAPWREELRLAAAYFVDHLQNIALRYARLFTPGPGGPLNLPPHPSILNSYFDLRMEYYESGAGTA